MVDRSERLNFDYWDFCICAGLALMGIWMLAGMASLLIDLGGWDIWGRVALTQALAFCGGTAIFAGAAARRAARKRDRPRSGGVFMAFGFIVAVAFTAFAVNVWIG